ncbi:MAG: nickel pincer cofactor biosynthesis protein LarC [Candidatus Azobacteroides sp.]|nr:nickel pincer cofactor biosynthesis protein LarC [Candidatus Azobacteroides sp.]
MKTLYFDCFSGISGDMTLAALVDLGVDKDLLIHELQKLNLPGWSIEFSEVAKHGIRAKRIEVVSEEHTHVHRHMTDIASLIDNSSISERAKDSAKRIFMRLAIAEAKIHGTTPDEVHFHEVGAVDSIIDIAGAAICLDILSPDRICASVLRDGYGFVECQHGMIPVPVPAVTEMLAVRGVSFRQLDIEGELMTPTGAAIVLEMSESFGILPEMQIMKTGYGAGTREFSIPNVLRVLWGESFEAAASNSVTVIETNIDDTTSEILGYVMEKLFEAGAKDVFFTPIYMKKNRPATQLTVLCDDTQVARMEHILFTETSTIGLRKFQALRTCLPREIVKVTTPYGDVQAKKVSFDSKTRIALEYDDARRLAREKNIPLVEIYRSFR